MNTPETSTSSRQTAINGLAVAGFISLVTLGMWLAVYSTRFVPDVVGRVGSAAVYLGSVFTPSEEPSLSVVPTASSTIISFGGEPSSTPVTEPVATTPSTPVKPVTPTAGKTTTTTEQIGGATTAPSGPYGFPDLVVSISAIGYLATTSAESFVASSTVPAGSRPAVKFSIKNAGTNVAGAWRFSASIPTQTAYVYQSQPQQALNPGDSIDYTLGFDQANKGSGQMVSVTANFDRAITESNTNNNSASAALTILGS